MIDIKTRRNTVITLIVLILLLILLGIWLLLRAKPSQEPVNDQIIEPPEPTQEITDNTTEKKVPEISPEEATARVTATNFTERYGTYSTDSPFKNIEEVKEITTNTFFTQLKSTESELATTEFYGITTRALAIETIEGEELEGTVKYLVSTQQEETKQNRTEKTVTYRKAEITLNKTEGTWKVSAFQWK